MFRKRCKICGSDRLIIFAHTAKCRNCGILLYFPYPKSDAAILAAGEEKNWPKKIADDWYPKSEKYNQKNFTNMLKFAIEKIPSKKNFEILDYGGGGGQFASVCKTQLPRSVVYITDICAESLVDRWRELNIQIPFKHFADDKKKFDYIFLNDVLEHLSDPESVLIQLRLKLKPGGKIFIATPKQFWIYGTTQLFSKSLYRKVLQATVSASHLQIWSKKSFQLIIAASKLKVDNYKTVNEFTMPADFYLKNMEIKNSVLIFLGKFFYWNSRWLIRNKIYCLCSAKQ